MHTHSLRKRLNAHPLFAVLFFLVVLGTSVVILATQSAKALDSLSGSAIWVAPNVIQYTDVKGHVIDFYQQGNDASGTDGTNFNGETVTDYLKHNNDTDLCLNRGYTKSDPAATATVQGIRLIGGSNNPPYPYFHDNGSIGYIFLGGCKADGGGDLADPGTMKNARPDGTVPLPTDCMLGKVVWTSPYTLKSITDMTMPSNPNSDPEQQGSQTPDDLRKCLHMSNYWRSPQDSWLESSIGSGREFDQSSNISDGSMTFSSVPPIPTSTPPNECDSFDEHITIPYLNYMYVTGSNGLYSQYEYAQVYVPHLVNSNGTSCTDDPLAGWVNVVCDPKYYAPYGCSNDRPNLPPLSDGSVTASWTDKDKLQLNGNVSVGTGSDAHNAITDGTVFKQSSLTGSDMVLGASAECGSSPNTLEVSPYSLAPYAHLTVYGYGQNNRCGALQHFWIAIDNPYPGSNVDNSNDTGGGTPPGSSNTISCPVNDPHVGWILCPIFDLGSSAIQALNKQIQAVLFFNTDQFFGNNSSFQGSYNVFRNLGLSLLVLAGLVMVISQAAGLEIFSAYTIRKALPRIVIAAIGLSLAWPILQFVITFFNDLGAWITSIILTAAPQSKGDLGNVGGGIVDLIVGGGAAIFAGWTILGLLSLMFSAFLGLLIGYAVLVFRQVVIIVCVLLAPLAIAASILPGTERLWKFWRDTILGALLMFPIIMGFLAAGAAFASISNAAANGNNIPLEIIAVLSYFLPYFLITTVFGLVNGLMSNIYAMAHDRSKGVFEGFRKRRQEGRRRTRRDLAAGQRFNNANPLGRLANRPLGYMASGPTTLFGLNRRRARERVALNEAVLAAETAKDPRMQQLALNDDGIAAMFLSAGRGPVVGGGIAARRLRDLHSTVTGGVRTWERDWSEDRIRNAVASARAVGFNSANYGAAVQLVASNKARSLGTGQNTLNTIMDTLRDGSNGNAAVQEAHAGAFGFYARKSGRTDLGGIITNPAAPTLAGGWNRATMGELAQDTGDALQAHIDDVVDRALSASSSVDEKTEAAVQLMEMQNLLPHVAPDSQNRINLAMERRLGYDNTERNTRVEDYLVRRLGLYTPPIGRTPATGISGAALRSRARVYDNSLPESARGVAGTP